MMVIALVDISRNNTYCDSSIDVPGHNGDARPLSTFRNQGLWLFVHVYLLFFDHHDLKLWQLARQCRRFFFSSQLVLVVTACVVSCNGKVRSHLEKNS